MPLSPLVDLNNALKLVKPVFNVLEGSTTKVAGYQQVKKGYLLRKGVAGAGDLLRIGHWQMGVASGRKRLQRGELRGQGLVVSR